MNIHFNRRKLLIALPLMSLASSSSMARSLPVPRVKSESDLDKKISHFIAYLPQSAESRRIGKAYLDRVPQENDRYKLLVAIAGQDNLSSNASLLKLVSISHYDDLQENRLIIIDGWLFTNTEARLCALSYLG